MLLTSRCYGLIVSLLTALYQCVHKEKLTKRVADWKREPV
jgi:hypothetical protein